jgi:quinolinate synthase
MASEINLDSSLYSKLTPSQKLSLSKEQLVSEINNLKIKKNAVLLAHYYQEGEIQDIADYVGDSLGLSQQAAKTKADIIVFAGVVFMAETAKIISPEKKVVVPDINAGCSLSDNCPADKFSEFIQKSPGHVVISYINCSAEVKALSDIICTSSNAERVIDSVPVDKPIIFGPDKHLGAYLSRKTGRKMLLWDGACVVHETFDAKKIIQLKVRHPEAVVIAHPECPESVLNIAEHIGSTSSLLNFSKTSKANEFIVVTESGILHQMKKASPSKTFYGVPNEGSCDTCAECPFMRLNTMEKLYLSLLNETPEVTVCAELCKKALIPIERMLALG